MELRELRAFVAAARELHFGRAAARLSVSPSMMSESIRRLELELGTPLFTRTTRRILLTDAGTELFGRAETILELTAQATEAIGRIARGEAGQLCLGVTPPAALVIAPHLAGCFTAAVPGVSVEVERMWLPSLGAALLAGVVDVALTCGSLGLEDARLATCEIGSEPLLVGLRPDDPLAAESEIDLSRLARRTLGMHSADLFPAWHGVQRRVLERAGLEPRVTELVDTDLTARRWTRQSGIDWIMLTASLLDGHEHTVVRAAAGHSVAFTLSWCEDAGTRPAIRRFVDLSRQAELPTGWLPPAP